jgi:hypothetical protein
VLLVDFEEEDFEEEKWLFAKSMHEFSRGGCIGEYTGYVLENRSYLKLLKMKKSTVDNPIPLKDLHNWSVKLIDGFHVVQKLQGLVFGMNLLNHSCHSSNCNCKTVITANGSGKLFVVLVAICDM